MNRFASACAVILLVAAFFFTGCSSDSYSFVNSVSITDYDAWGIQYDKFNGQQQMEVTLEDGTHSFTVDIVTVSGKLDLDIRTIGGETLYTGNILPTSSFEALNAGAGTYIIRFTAKNHEGSFWVNWE